MLEGVEDPHRAPHRAAVLVVDDEPNILALLSASLRLSGFEVHGADSGARALNTAAQIRPDIVVLDVMLPDCDGFTLARRLRAQHDALPVLFLTARDGVDDRIAGLTAGGDDYVTKPFSLEEVAARLRGLLRRTRRAVVDDGLLVVGDLTLDEASHEVTRAGDEIRLTATEFELLRYLMRNPKRVLSVAQTLG